MIGVDILVIIGCELGKVGVFWLVDLLEMLFVMVRVCKLFIDLYGY